MLLNLINCVCRSSCLSYVSRYVLLKLINCICRSSWHSYLNVLSQTTRNAVLGWHIVISIHCLQYVWTENNIPSCSYLYTTCKHVANICLKYLLFVSSYIYTTQLCLIYIDFGSTLIRNQDWQQMPIIPYMVFRL